MSREMCLDAYALARWFEMAQARFAGFGQLRPGLPPLALALRPARRWVHIDLVDAITREWRAAYGYIDGRDGSLVQAANGLDARPRGRSIGTIAAPFDEACIGPRGLLG